MADKIKYSENNSNFFNELKTEVNLLIDNSKVKSKSSRVIMYKLIMYSSLFVLSYSLICFSNHSSFQLLIVNYCLFGLLGILLAFNASHDAVHNTLFKSKKVNSLVHYLIFNLQGVNATLWKKRHLYSHHIFPNVDGCDADIDDNPFIRLSLEHKHKSIHKYQYLYAPLIYCLYTLHWILIKDFVYLNKKRVANMTNIVYSKKFIFETILLKLVYLFITIGLPIIFTNFSSKHIILAFIFMHFFISIFFVLTLIISHLTLETVFPKVDKKGCLPFDYYTHQLAVSMDYHPTNKFANYIFGGFNSHSAHHLFPNVKHTLYTQITPLIQAKTNKYNLPYNELNIIKAIKSHFLYLKKLGNKDISNQYKS